MLVDSENSVVKLSPVVDSMVVKGIVENVVSLGKKVSILEVEELKKTST